MTPKFLYFDLGKVLLDFSFERMCRQMGDAAGIAAAQVREILLTDGLQAQYETGRVDSRGAYDFFCAKTNTRPDYDAFCMACNDIFTPIDSMLKLVARLHQAGCRLGVLSNTCEGHWKFCVQRYPMLSELFHVHALSFEIGAMKPDAAIFLNAAELAGCRPDEIFYTDDIAGHIAGARSVGIDAVVYESTPQIVSELRQRGLNFSQ